MFMAKVVLADDVELVLELEKSFLPDLGCQIPVAIFSSSLYGASGRNREAAGVSWTSCSSRQNLHRVQQPFAGSELDQLHAGCA